jgi:hypothetical protein
LPLFLVFLLPLAARGVVDRGAARHGRDLA